MCRCRCKQNGLTGIMHDGKRTLYSDLCVIIQKTKIITWVRERGDEGLASSFLETNNFKKKCIKKILILNESYSNGSLFKLPD